VHQLVNKKNFDNIKMHGATVKIHKHISASVTCPFLRILE